MTARMRLPFRTLLIAGALLAQVALAQGPPRSGGPIFAGDPFPAVKLKNLNTASGQPAEVDLAPVLGKKAIVLCYWIAGNSRSEEVLLQLQSLASELGQERLAVYSLVMLRPGREADAIRERVQALKVRVPVLDDEEFKIGNRLRVQSVPSIALIDREGHLRLANGAVLSQTLEYQMDLKAAIRRAAETGKVGTYGYLDRYYPVKELVGKPCPDFTAPLLSGKAVQSSSTLLDTHKLNVLIFWSVDCPHCRHLLPEINTWLKQNPAEVNVVSAAKVTNPATKTKTQEFCNLNGFVFPTIEDDSKISDQFLVTSTPTILIIRPDRIVDSVLLSDLADFGKAIEERKRLLLKSAGS
jgi:thiol-disulfide isomerase/thioredoxin